MRKNIHSKHTICYIAAETASALISAGASTAAAGGSIFTAKKNREWQEKENQKAREWSEKQMATQRRQEIEDRNYENAYNDPANVRARLIAAGLAADSAVGQIVSNGASASADSVAAQSPSEYAPNGIGQYVDPIATGIGGLTQLAQLANIKANTENTKADTENKGVLTDKINAETEAIKANTHFTELNSKSQEIINTYLDEKERLSIDKTKQDMQYTEEQTKQIRAACEKLRKEIDDMMPAELKKLVAETGLLGEKSLSEQKNREQIDKIIEKCDFEIDLLCEQTGLARLDILNYTTNHMQAGFMGTGLSLTNMRRELEENGMPDNKEVRDAVVNSTPIGRAADNLVSRRARKALSKTTDLHSPGEVKYTSDGRAYYPYRKKKK